MTTKERQLFLPGLPINIYDLSADEQADDLRATFQIYIIRDLRNGGTAAWHLHNYFYSFGPIGLSHMPGGLNGRKLVGAVFELTELPQAAQTEVTLREAAKHAMINENAASVTLSGLIKKDYLKKQVDGRSVRVSFADRFMVYSLLSMSHPDYYKKLLATGNLYEDLEAYYFSPLNRYRDCLVDPNVKPLERV